MIGEYVEFWEGGKAHFGLIKDKVSILAGRSDSHVIVDNYMIVSKYNKVWMVFPRDVINKLTKEECEQRWRERPAILCQAGKEADTINELK